jgi:hypothetical protein
MKDVELMKHVSVRFPAHMKARVSGHSRRLKVPVSEVIRQAVASQLPTWEKNGKGQQTPRTNGKWQNGKT